jgi:pimeloyl-ACP methyl ester carboxylesterase
MTRSERTIRTSHADLRVTESGGAGAPILMLHGSGSCRQVFDAQLASRLGERRRLIVPDLPGHGESSDAIAPERTYTLTGLADCMGELMAELGIARALVFGWSLGGHIGIEMLSRGAGVAGLMISGAPPVGRGPLGMLRGFQTSFDLLLASRPNYSDKDVRRYAQLCYGEAAAPALVAAIRRSDGRMRSIFSRSMMRGDGADQRRTVEAAAVPVAVVNGAEDPLVRMSYVASIRYSTLWRNLCHVVPDAGHSPFLQQPAAFNALFADFAADVAAFRSPQAQPFAQSA